MSTAVVCVHPSVDSCCAPCAAPCLQAWTLHTSLRAKLAALLNTLAVSTHFRAESFACVQVWLAAHHPPAEALLICDPGLCLIGDRSLSDFRAASCQAVQEGRHGMPGRVWRNGSVQVVQQVRIIPPSLHPRSRLADAVTSAVAEVVYVPVFCALRPSSQPVAVLEALLSARSTESMLVANFISWVGATLTGLQLSLSSPLPTPVEPSSLAARRIKPKPEDDSDCEDISSDDDDDATDPTPSRPAPQTPPQARAARPPPTHPYMQRAAAAAAVPKASNVVAALAALVVEEGPCTGVAPTCKRATEPGRSALPGSGSMHRDGGAHDDDLSSRPVKLRRVASVQRTKSVPSLEALLCQADRRELTTPAQSC